MYKSKKLAELFRAVAEKMKAKLDEKVSEIRAEDIEERDVDEFVNVFVNMVGYITTIEVFEKTAEALEKGKSLLKALENVKLSKNR